MAQWEGRGRVARRLAFGCCCLRLALLRSSLSLLHRSHIHIQSATQPSANVATRAAARNGAAGVRRRHTCRFLQDAPTSKRKGGTQAATTAARPSCACDVILCSAAASCPEARPMCPLRVPACAPLAASAARTSALTLAAPAAARLFMPLSSARCVAALRFHLSAPSRS